MDKAAKRLPILAVLLMFLLSHKKAPYKTA